MYLEITGVGTPHITNLRMYHVDDEQDLIAGKIFSAPFKDELAALDLGFIRFMDRLATNLNACSRWSHRNRMDNYTWGGMGYSQATFIGTTSGAADAYTSSFSGLTIQDGTCIDLYWHTDGTPGVTSTLTIDGGTTYQVFDHAGYTTRYTSTTPKSGVDIRARLVFSSLLNGWVQDSGYNAQKLPAAQWPPELCMALCEEAGITTAWINVPIFASDDDDQDWVTQFCTMAAASYPDIHVILEGGNERWGGIIRMYDISAKLASARGYTAGWEEISGRDASLMSQAAYAVYGSRSKYSVIINVQTTTLPGNQVEAFESDDFVTETGNSADAAKNWVAGAAITAYVPSTWADVPTEEAAASTWDAASEPTKTSLIEAAVDAMDWQGTKDDIEAWADTIGLEHSTYPDLELFVYEGSANPGRVDATVSVTDTCKAFRLAQNFASNLYTYLLDLWNFARSMGIRWNCYYLHIHNDIWGMRFSPDGGLYAPANKGYEALVADSLLWRQESVVPTNMTAPYFSGVFAVGETITVWHGHWWAGNDRPTYAYQWYADSVAISGATSNTYDLTASEEGAVIRCDVTATNGSGSATESTADSAAVSAAEITVWNVAYDGTTSGMTLQASTANATTDVLGGSNALLISTTNNNISGFVTNPTNSLTFKDGTNRLRFYARPETWPTAQAWIQFRAQDMSTTGQFSVRIDDPTAATKWVNTSGSTITSGTVTDAGNNWVYADINLNITGADLVGAYNARMSSTAYAGSINAASTHSFSLYDLKITKLP